jgi:DNA-binding MarR family transcriptional regulator
MKIPQYTITNLILKYIVNIEKKAYDIREHPLPLKKYQSLYQTIQTENIQALSELLNIGIGYDKALSIFEGKEVPKLNNPLNILINFRSANEFIKAYNVNNQPQPSNQLVVHLNTLLGTHVTTDWDLGKFRDFGDKIIPVFDEWITYREFYPQVELKKHFDELFNWINYPADNSHLLIQTAILLYEFIDKAPLLVLNQTTVIALIEVVLKIGGYNYQNLSPFVQTLNSINADIGLALKISRKQKDLTSFIELFLYALSLATIDLHNNVINIVEESSVYTIHAKEALNYRQLKALSYIEDHGRIKRSDYANMMGISFMTAYRDLKEMEEKEFIKSRGTGKATYYTLTSAIRDEISKRKTKDKIDIPTIGERFDTV